MKAANLAPNGFRGDAPAFDTLPGNRSAGNRVKIRD
jgi:hypothetical protein